MAETEEYRERTVIDRGTRDILKSFFDKGMTRVGSPLIQEASAATGLNTCVVENWIGNYKRAFNGPSLPPKPKLLTRDLSAYNLFCREVLKNKGTMKDMKGWSSLGEEDRDRYKQEAAALKSSSKSQDLSPEMRAQKIKKHLKQLKLEVSKLEELGVETAALSVDCLNPVASLCQVSSKKAAGFLETTDTANKFAFHFAASSSSSATDVESVHALVKKVQDFFNRKYMAAGGSGRLPYHALVNQTLDIQVAGLPGNLTLRKPSFYGRKQLEMILNEADQISFQIRTQQVNSLETARPLPQAMGKETEVPSVDTAQSLPQDQTAQSNCMVTGEMMDTDARDADACVQTMTVEEILESMCGKGAEARQLQSSEGVNQPMNVNQDAGAVCSVCGIDFYDKTKNKKKMWRSWSQCIVCHAWSHTACGFKRNLCAHCQD